VSAAFDVAANRRATEALLRAVPPAPGTRVRERTLAGRRALVVEAGARRAAGVLLWVHGGAYVAGSVDANAGFASRLAAAAGVPVVLPSYRLAPEHPYPAGLDDVSEALDALAAERGPEAVVVGGDSAGAGLALAAMVLHRDTGHALPAGGVLLCPFADLTLDNASWTAPDTDDPLIDRAAFAEIVGLYTSGDPAADPYISPARADLHGLPPLLIFASDAEALRDDAHAIAAAAPTARLVTRPGLTHVWHLQVATLAAAREDVALVGSFVAERLTAAPSVR
jgi:monoterpene epsilon-lactone hydrolase